MMPLDPKLLGWCDGQDAKIALRDSPLPAHTHLPPATRTLISAQLGRDFTDVIKIPELTFNREIVQVGLP